MFAQDTVYVSSQCLQTYPCQHYVTFSGKEKLMWGGEIYNLYNSLGLPVPKHFQEYAKFAHPNPSKVQYTTYPKPPQQNIHMRPTASSNRNGIDDDEDGIEVPGTF